jgi:putative exporter of polyketide antibiotics
MEDIMSPRTFFLSRLIGLFLILVVLSLAVHKQATVDLLTGFFHSPEMMFVLSIITLAAGLAMVLAHNIWSGGAQAVVVTLVGWLTLIKGLLYLLQFHEMVGECILSWLHHPLVFYLWLTPSLLIGIYLTYEGFRSRPAS